MTNEKIETISFKYNDWSFRTLFCKHYTHYIFKKRNIALQIMAAQNKLLKKIVKNKRMFDHSHLLEKKRKKYIAGRSNQA